MSLGDLLRASWTVHGLDAPAFAWVAAVLLPGWALAMLLRLAWTVRRQAAVCARAARGVEAIRRAHPVPAGQGLDEAGRLALGRLFEGLPTLRPAWWDLEAQLLVEARGTFAPVRAETAFSDAAVVAPQLHRALYRGLPGLMTGLGLLVTFLAILVALLDVRLEANQVRGLDTLIRGLSGKFVASVAALGGASAFLLAEPPLLRAVDRGRRRLCAALDATLPRLEAARLLLRVEGAVTREAAALEQLAGAAGALLRGVEGQLAETHGALQELTSLARRTTAEQAAHGRAQVDELGALVRGLAAEAREGTGQALAQLTTGLTGVVHELSTAVTRLGGELERRLVDGTTRTVAAVESVLGEAERWSAGSAERLAVLHGSLEALLDRAGTSVAAFAPVAAELQGVTRQLAAAAAAAAGAGDAAARAASAMGLAAESTAREVEALAARQREQEAAWGRLEEGIRRYQDVFATVERSAGALLAQIAQHLASYSETTRRGLSEAIGLSHDYLADATQRLRGSIDELDEHLGTLRDVLDDVLRRHHVRA